MGTERFHPTIKEVVAISIRAGALVGAFYALITMIGAYVATVEKNGFPSGNRMFFVINLDFNFLMLLVYFIASAGFAAILTLMLAMVIHTLRRVMVIGRGALLAAFVLMGAGFGAATAAIFGDLFAERVVLLHLAAGLIAAIYSFFAYEKAARSSATG